jgi:hypothetical protein
MLEIADPLSAKFDGAGARANRCVLRRDLFEGIQAVSGAKETVTAVTDAGTAMVSVFVDHTPRGD